MSMSHISANNIDRKLICVSLSLMSGPKHQNMVILLVCGRCEFSMFHILANNGDRNLMLVSISMFSGSKKPNRINWLFFKLAATLIRVAITSMQNNYMFLFVVSAVVYSYEAPYAITLNKYNFTCSYAT